MRRAARPARVVTAEGIVWHLADETHGLEVVLVGGKLTRVAVDTDTFCYRMTCLCGRIRYAKPNTLTKVRQCRVCAIEGRINRRRLK